MSTWLHIYGLRDSTSSPTRTLLGFISESMSPKQGKLRQLAKGNEGDTWQATLKAKFTSFPSSCEPVGVYL
jgi:hypothetical protein